MRRHAAAGAVQVGLPPAALTMNTVLVRQQTAQPPPYEQSVEDVNTVLEEATQRPGHGQGGGLGGSDITDSGAGGGFGGGGASLPGAWGGGGCAGLVGERGGFEPGFRRHGCKQGLDAGLDREDASWRQPDTGIGFALCATERRRGRSCFTAC